MTIKAVIPINSTDSTVSRLVVKTVIQQLMYMTEIDNVKDIIYKQRNDFSAQNQYYDYEGEQGVKLDADNFIKVEYSETIHPEIYDVSQYQIEYPSIFRNKALDIILNPMYCKKNLEMRVTYQSKSFDDITKWMNAFNRSLLTSTAMNTHNILYNYSIPDEILAYLRCAYLAQENINGYGMTEGDFIKNSSITNGLIVRQNLNGKADALSVYVENSNCLGIYTSMPEVQETSLDPPTSSIQFTYTLQYDRITALLLFLQLYVHNQVIDISYLGKYCDRRYHQPRVSGNLTVTQSVQYITPDLYTNLTYPANSTAITDGWLPPTTPKYIITETIIPIQISPSDLTTVLNLNLLTEFGYPQWLITMMGNPNAYINNLYNWPIYLDLFEVNTTTTNIGISVDSNLNLITNNNFNTNMVLNNVYVIMNLGTGINWTNIGVDPTTIPVIGSICTYNGNSITGNGDGIVRLKLDLRSRYYLRISTVYYLYQFNFLYLQKQPSQLLQLLQYLNPNVTLDILGNNGFATTESIMAAINLIASMTYVPNGLMTVQATSVVAKRFINN